MPLPLIIGAAALAVSAYGAKKTYDAHKDYEKADAIDSKAERVFKKAKYSLVEARHDSKTYLEYLGELKFYVYDNSLIPFVNHFSKIKNIDFDDSKLLNATNLPKVSQDALNSLNTSALTMTEVTGAGVAALGAGGLAGLATYGSVGLLGSASTGTAIAGLSGAAATNATLAWLGGGSLATGGLGIAGGTAILGGIVAAPVLAIGGMILASKAEEAKENARANLAESELLAEQMETATVQTNAISMRLKEVSELVANLHQRFTPMLTDMITLIDNNSDYSSYGVDEKQKIMMCLATASTMKNVLETPILNQDGSLTQESQDVLQQGSAVLAG